MHIVIAPDKFKGSLTGVQAAEAIRAGFAVSFPDASFDILPMADGGEGLLEAFASGSGSAEIRTATVRNALGENVTAEFLVSDGTAVIESSQSNGLYLIPKADRDISRTNTFGVGQLIHAAISAGAVKILIGIGGSATNDAGLGLADALGCRFLDENGNSVEPIPANIGRITSIDSSEMIRLPPITVACDVSNPLLGQRGATRVYGQQKGLQPAMADEAESGMRYISDLSNSHFNSDFTVTPGAGAAGGLGYGLMTYCGAKLVPGFDCIAEALGAEKRIAKADLVLTGEGSLDSQTLEGKTPYGVSKIARRHGIPVFALAGSIRDDFIFVQHFDGIASIINEPMTLDEAISDAANLLEKAAARLAHLVKGSRSK